jgi:hypothetical protein
MATQSLIEAVIAHDATRLEAMLDMPLTYAGLYFADPECNRQFPAASSIGEDRRAAFARCLTTLPLHEASRTDVLFGVSVLEYVPGIEIEAVFRFPHNRPRLAWIGYSGRRDLRDGLPTVSPTALEAGRILGDPIATPTPDEARAIEAENASIGVHFAYAWLKVCIDTTGVVTGVHAREVSSPRAEAAFTAAIQRWKFRPFVFGTQPLPVCSLIRFSHPRTTATGEDNALPIAFPAADGFVRVPRTQTKRISGVVAIVPDDDDKMQLQRSGGSTLVGSFRYCFDEQGKVVDVLTLEPTGLWHYDTRIRTSIAQWKFKPYILDGKAVKACSAVNFIYQQR